MADVSILTGTGKGREQHDMWYLWMLCMKLCSQLLVRMRLDGQRCLYRQHLQDHKHTYKHSAFSSRNGAVKKIAQEQLMDCNACRHLKQEWQFQSKSLQDCWTKCLGVLLQPVLQASGGIYGQHGWTAGMRAHPASGEIDSDC
jgi:hypothetical protein